MNALTRKCLNEAIRTNRTFAEVAGIASLRTEPWVIPISPGPSRKAKDNPVCKVCGEQPGAAYFRSSKKSNGRKYLDSRCDGCRRLGYICRNLAITVTQYRKLMEDSGSQCRICKRPFTEVKQVIDHCHETGKLRSAICGQCNQGLGLFRDDSDALLSAVAYIEHWRLQHSREPQTEHDLRRETNMSRIRNRRNKP